MVGIDRLPKNLRLSEDTQSMGDKLLQAFKASKMSEKTFNNGRLAKGLKQFFKDKNPTIEQMVAIIEAMNKDVWHANYPKPKGSPEAKNYAENFAEKAEQIEKAKGQRGGDTKETIINRLLNKFYEQFTQSQRTSTDE